MTHARPQLRDHTTDSHYKLVKAYLKNQKEISGILPEQNNNGFYRITHELFQGVSEFLKDMNECNKQTNAFGNEVNEIIAGIKIFLKDINRFCKSSMSWSCKSMISQHKSMSFFRKPTHSYRKPRNYSDKSANS